MVRMAILVAALAVGGCGEDKTSPNTTTSGVDDNGPDSTGSGDNTGTNPNPTTDPNLGGTDTDKTPDLQAELIQCANNVEAACTTVRELAESTLDDLTPQQDYRVGYIFDQGMGGDPDPITARGHYTRACEGGWAIACTLLGKLYEEGKAGGPPDLKAAAVYYGRACEAGEGESCFRQARALETGSAGTTKPAVARELYGKACDRNVAPGCNNFAAMLRDGEGGKADQAQARVLFKRACDAKFALGCANLGTMIANGHGGEKNLEEGKKYLQQACGLGNEAACGIVPMPDAGPKPPQPATP